MLTAARITLIIEKEIFNPELENLGIPNTSEYEWVKTNVFTDDIMEFEQKGKYTQIILMNREMPVLVRESFDSLENRLKELENGPDSKTIAQQVAEHLVTILQPTEKENP